MLPIDGRTVLVAVPEDEGISLDRFLAARVAGLSRREARVLVGLGGVDVGGARAEPAPLVRAGDVIAVRLGGALERACRSTGQASGGGALPHRILHEDEDVVVVDKPTGMLTCAPPGDDRVGLAEMLGRVWVVQRLDAPTSGVLVLARNEAANRALARRLQAHDVDRVYDAVVRGPVAFEQTSIHAPLRGRRALTRLAVVDRFGDLATRLACTLDTGRTHQIRLHCARAGHPILGDPRHGQRTAWDPPRLALHAARLGFDHPRTGDRLVFESPLPADLSAWLAELAEMAGEAAR